MSEYAGSGSAPLPHVVVHPVGKRLSLVFRKRWTRQRLPQTVENRDFYLRLSRRVLDPLRHGGQNLPQRRKELTTRLLHSLPIPLCNVGAEQQFENRQFVVRQSLLSGAALTGRLRIRGVCSVRMRHLVAAICALMLALTHAHAQHADSAGQLRVALVKQPFVPTGTSVGPTTMANGGIQDALRQLGATVRVSEIALTPQEEPEYGPWKRLAYALGHLGRTVAENEKDGYFTIGLLGTCPSMPGMVAGLQHSGPTLDPLKVGMLWLDAHPDFNTPETTRSGSLGGMPVAVATGRCLTHMRLDAGLDPPLSDSHVVMGGVRLIDPLEQSLLDESSIEQLTVQDLRTISPALTSELDRLSRLVDKIYVHIDMDVLDPREVAGHPNKVPGGPTSEELARLFETIFRRYPKAVAIGFATIPPRDADGASIAALNRMILGAVKGLRERTASAR